MLENLQYKSVQKNYIIYIITEKKMKKIIPLLYIVLSQMFFFFINGTEKLKIIHF